MASTVATTNGMVIFTQVFPQDSPQAQALTGKVNDPPTSKIPEHLQQFLKGEPQALGTTQIMIGITCIIFGVALAIQQVTFVIYAGLPFWTSLLFIISGSVAVAAARNPNTCLIKSTLGLNVISAIIASINLIMYSIDIGNDPRHYMPPCDQQGMENYYYGCAYSQQTVVDSIQCLKALLLVFTLLEFCIAVSLSVFGCKATYQETGLPMIVVQTIPSLGRGKDSKQPEYEELTNN